MLAYRRGRVCQRAADQRGIFFQTPPVPLISKSLSSRNANRGENTPAAKQSGLPWRQADFINRHQPVVMKDVPVNHTCSGSRFLLYLKTGQVTRSAARLAEPSRF